MSLQQDNARVDGAVKDLEWGDDDVATDPSSESHSRATTTTARVTTTITSQTPNRAASTSPAPIVIYPKEKKEEDPIRAIQKYLPHLVVDRKIDGIDVDEYEASAANDSSSDGVKVLPVPASLANDHLVDKVSSSVSSSMFDPQPLSKSPSFIAFRASVQRHRCQVGREAWTYYDLGPKDPTVQPLILLPGTSGTAEGQYETNNRHCIVYHQHTDPSRFSSSVSICLSVCLSIYLSPLLFRLLFSTDGARQQRLSCNRGLATGVLHSR